VDAATLFPSSDPVRVLGFTFGKSKRLPVWEIPQCSLAAERSPKEEHMALCKAVKGISLGSGAAIFQWVREKKVLALKIHPSCSLRRSTLS